jgi:hypothetical protein
MNARADLPMGLVYDLASDDYHALDALGSSGIKKLARSPRHFFAQSLDPERPISEPSPAMKAGTLAHCAILEPASTKEGKAWALTVPQGVELVTLEQMRAAMCQAASIRMLPEIAALLSKGQPEVSAFWTDDATGEHCKCRPDWVSPTGEGVILVDVKTTQDASPGGFPRSIAKFGYHLQAAWYSDGFERASGQRVLGFVFAVVEADYPHAAAAYMLDDESIEKGRAECRRLLQLYADCKRSGDWPGYPNTIQPLALPAWA